MTIVFNIFRYFFWFCALVVTLISLWFVAQIVWVKSGEYSYYVYAPDGHNRYRIIAGPLAQDKNNRQVWVHLRQIPQACQEMLLIAEDPGFYQHRGIQIYAMWQALQYNLRQKRFVFGGSTLTQQLVKNLFLWREKTLIRKGLETVGAVFLDIMMSKEEQLAWYFNIAEFGPNIYGVNQASAFYFHKPIAKLTQSECVVLTGLLTEPNRIYRMMAQNQFDPYEYDKMKNIAKEYVKKYPSLLDQFEGFYAMQCSVDSDNVVK